MRDDVKHTSRVRRDARSVDLASLADGGLLCGLLCGRSRYAIDTRRASEPPPSVLTESTVMNGFWTLFLPLEASQKNSCKQLSENSF